MKRRHGQANEDEEMEPSTKRLKTEDAEKLEPVQVGLLDNVLQHLPETSYQFQQNAHLRAVERDRQLQKNRLIKEQKI